MRPQGFFCARFLFLVSCALMALAGAPTPALPHQEQEDADALSSSAVTLSNPDGDAYVGDPALAGQWAAPITWPQDAVHQIVLHTGKVLFFRGDETSTPPTYTWDPVTGQVASQTAGAIIFCAGNSFLSDGRVLVTGGAEARGVSEGPKYTFIFDPLTSQWSRGPDMRNGRYYPTNTVLGDGRTLIFSGTDQNGKTNDQVEAYVVGGGPGGTDVIDLLVGANKIMNYYPRMHLLPSGLIFHVGHEKIADALDPVAQSWQVVATSNYGKRTHGTSVMLPPGHERFMILGGHNRSGTDPLATNTAEIIDLSQPASAWSFTNPMNHRRMHANATILPDGKVLVAGGTSDENVTAVFPAEIFDPATKTWTVVASLRTFRGYHSSMVLLPDGRVVMAGSNGNSTAEIYSPPYLFRGARPVIDSAPGAVQYGQTFSVQTPDAASITSVVFMRLSATTHMVNMEQRYVPVTFTQGATGGLNVVAPNEANIAPPGYYMLFILNANGIPSVAKFVLLGGTPTGNQRPRVDAGPSQTITFPGSATLDGTVSDDGQPSPPGAVSTLWSKDSGPGTVSFADAGAVDTTAGFSASGLYVLRLTADDGALTASDTVTIHVNDPNAGGSALDIRISSSSDDAEEAASGSMSLTSSDLELVFHGSIQKVGLHFNNVAVAQGTTILRAWVQFMADEVQSEATSLTIQGQAVDNAPTFTTTAGNISSRARTTAAVSWAPVAWTTVGEAGINQRTPDLSPVIQEIVDRPGWANGNSLVLIITGTGHRTADSFDGNRTGAPLLHLELGAKAVNTPPTVDAGPGQTIRLPATASLNGTVTDDGLPSPPGAVTTAWAVEVGPGTVTFADANAVDTTASFSTSGTYVLELTADDGEFSATDTVTINVDEAAPGVVTVERRVAASADDAEEKGTSIYLSSSDLELVFDGKDQTVGLRFTGISIPPGASIVSATVQFKADEVQSEATALTIQGQAVDNAPAFTATTGNISSRAKTTAAVPWSPDPWTIVGEAGPNQRTPDLSAVIQEIVNRPGWASGNALVFIITGTGHRTAEAFDGVPASAPFFRVEFN